jgi:Uma2 family endonuclease
VVQTKAKPATYADIEALPPHVTGEILFGVLHTHPRPARKHVIAASRIGGIIGQTFDFGTDDPDGWVILDEPELHPGENVVAPDLAGWKRKRFIEREEGPWFEVVPDWICELQSPSTRQKDLGPKRIAYAESGVGHLWYIDPLAKSLEVFARVEKNWLLIQTVVGSDDVTAPPFETLTFSLGRLWPFD